MPIPGFSLVSPPEYITGGEAVEMVMERFNFSGCTEDESFGWLNKQVKDGLLKLAWAGYGPELLNGLYLDGEGFIYFPGFPGAQAIDEIDWKAGELCRRVRYPEIVDRWDGRDPSTMTQAARLARDKELRARYERNALSVLYSGQCAADDRGEPERWVTEELRYRFTVKRLSLASVLNRASVPLGTARMPLSEAAEVTARRFNVSRQVGLEAIIEAAAAERIEVYGTPNPEWQRVRIDPGVWRQMARGKPALCGDDFACEAHGVAWSNPYVFRGDLDQLVRELDGDAAATEAGTVKPVPGVANGYAEPAQGSSGPVEDGAPELPRDTLGLRRKAGDWLADYVAEKKHRDRDSTLAAMRAAHSGLGIRGSRAVWSKFAKASPGLRLSLPGRKSKRNTSN